MAEKVYPSNIFAMLFLGLGALLGVVGTAVAFSWARSGGPREWTIALVVAGLTGVFGYQTRRAWQRRHEPPPERTGDV